MNGLLADARHGFRMFRRTPLASLLALGILAVGLAFVGSFLSLYVDSFLRPHPGIAQSGRIVTVGLTNSTIQVGLLERIADEVSSLEAVAGIYAATLEIGRDREARNVEFVTRNFFGGIRPKLALGRGFDDSDHAAEAAPVAVISHDYWQERFGRSPDVLGQVVELPPRSFTAGFTADNSRSGIFQQEAEAGLTEFRIVGVMAPEMSGLSISTVALWLPLERAVRLFYPPERLETGRRSLPVSTVGRRAPGASTRSIVSELQARYSDLDGYNLQSGFRFEVLDGIVRNFNVHRDAKRQLQLFLVGSILLALVAAANTSLFLIARAPGRRRELGIRTSVGAPMKRLARQLAIESGILVLPAVALGLIFSIWLSKVLQGLSFFRGAEWIDVTLLDWRVLSLLVVFLTLVTLVVSFAPILGLKRLGISASSRQVAMSATQAQRFAITAQIAIAGAFGSAGIAFAWHLGSLMLGYPGYETDDLYVAEFSRTGSFFVSLSVVEQERWREATESLPSVQGVAFGGPVPGHGAGRSSRTVSDPNDPTREIHFVTGTIDSRFIDMLGLRLLYGRAPNDSEIGVAVINRMAARRYFERDNVVGESLPIADRGGTSSEIVGVLADLSFGHPAAEVEPLVFLTASQESRGGRGTVIRSPSPVAELQKELQGLLDTGAFEVDSVSLTPLALLRSRWIAPDRARGFLTLVTSSLVVLLALIGFYGTQHYLVAAGREEYAIRGSLGAGPRALGRLILRRGVILSLPGLGIGGLIAFFVVAWLRDDFVSRDISAGAVTIAIVVGLTALLLVASIGPAREAKRTQPAPLLRED